MVDFLESMGVNLLFTVGGDGTQRGAHAIAAEAQRRRVPLAVVGIPKTIDDDLSYFWESFGYETALEKACEVLDCAHAEAKGVPNGVSLVKLMGRDSVTLFRRSLSSLGGDHGFLACLKKRIVARGHAVIVVAEGAGQELMPSGETESDASGNVKPRDIGPFLRDRVLRYLVAEGIPTTVRYFDPSYIIRSVPANTDDCLLCDRFARNAAHAAMAGKTDVLIGMWYNTFIHVPIPLAIEGKKRLRPESEVWRAVQAATGQPPGSAGSEALAVRVHGALAMAPDFFHGRAASAVGRLEAADITNPNCRSARQSHGSACSSGAGSTKLRTLGLTSLDRRVVSRSRVNPQGGDSLGGLQPNPNPPPLSRLGAAGRLISNHVLVMQRHADPGCDIGQLALTPNHEVLPTSRICELLEQQRTAHLFRAA